MWRPSSTASEMMRHIRLPARMASSLPGITYWIRSGSQLVSTTATIGMPELVGLGDGDVLLLGVDDEHRVGELGQVADAAQVALQLLQLPAEDERLLLGHGLEVARLLHALVLLHLLHPGADGAEVGEHPAQPALVDVGHAALAGVVGDGVLGLLLGADEQDRAAVGDHVADERVGGVDAHQRLHELPLLARGNDTGNGFDLVLANAGYRRGSTTSTAGATATAATAARWRRCLARLDQCLVARIGWSLH